MQVQAVRTNLAQAGNPKLAKEELGKLLIAQFHDQTEAVAAALEWNRIHSQRLVPEEMPDFVLRTEASVVDVLKDTGLASSKNQARQLIAGGGVRIDGVKVEDAALLINPTSMPPQAGAILQVGRRHFVRLLAA